ncbi:MAG: type III restriction endonuclease subunit R [Geobacteraceae bacterium GWC2_55_20]|nr:MAG: type III restriction endonuclease subunit R [Geobacteraceae bacterium GWC2_55_20]OGU25001.1 MAG: type III restriction endonuclease subunit R [Geobacteraceae bacterium GWF2_54_21]HCE67385.1 type III restriction endonuclease subunit R [Geobacter sp.]
MKIQFDANQQFQLDAVAAVTDLFDGQPQGAPEFSVINMGSIGELYAGQDRTELGIGNRLVLDETKLSDNVRTIQAANDIEVADVAAPLEAWELFDGPANQARRCPHFSVEMETGTGKTYVYLRTVFELSRQYGFQKFIIVVPSVAIREGVLKNIEITAEHFRALYNNIPFEHFVYDAKKVNRLRQFATSNTLQILVINIDAFRKNFTGTEAEQKSNVIYKESDKLSGRQPIEFVQAARPIVIIDEPQSVDSTDKAQEAIKALNPFCTLRYSATHRNPYNLVYRLDPVRAFELKLVKQIVVASAAAEGAANDAFVRVESIDYKSGIKAKLKIHVQTSDGPKEKTVTVKQGADLYTLSAERAIYAQGYSVAEINAEPGNEFIRFNNGRTLKLGEECGGMRDDVWRTQIKHTVKRHLEKEIQLKERGIKVLSLFFIDRVANYRDYDAAGQLIQGKFAAAFEAELRLLAKEERYKDLEWLKQPIEKLHNGYFAKDKKGVLKDTRGDSQADDEVYNLIMKEKEQLLSMDEPLRFIFSHSALREGWDNPNVFQICTLNETRSAVKKRQEIGRGLRLPVDQNGLRVFDESVNKLYVMANESYEDFAKALQTEYEEECGVTFGKVPITALAKLVQVVDGEEKHIGRAAAETIRTALVAQKMLDADGRIQPAFNPKGKDFKIELPEPHQELRAAVIDLLASYQIERHIRRERDDGPNKLKKEIYLTPEFTALWDNIKPKTTYRVEFQTEELVQRAVAGIKRMERIEKPHITVSAGQLGVQKGGIVTRAVSVAEEQIEFGNRPIPDLLAYLQNETELTRSTLVRILKEAGRLDEFFNNPQRFLDAVASILKYELHRLLVDGIKYERVIGTGTEAAWEMMLFKNEELINYLTALPVNKSVYEYVVYDSEIEREFAMRLDEREDIKLFVKLPGWFKVDTPVGGYNPDWAILKHDDQALYLVRETKGTRDFLKLRTSEADKVRCGKKHFEALGVPFAVAVTADEF